MDTLPEEEAHGTTSPPPDTAEVSTSDARLLSIVEQALAGVAELDLTAAFTRVNHHFCAITGYSAGELLTRRLHDITHPDDLPHCLDIFERGEDSGSPFVKEKRYVRPDGAWVWVTESVSLIRDPAGRPESVVSVAVDITARKRAELNATFLAGLGDAFARLSSPDDIIQAVGEEIRRYFNVSRLTVAEVNAEANEVTNIYDTGEPDLERAVGTQPLSAYVSEESLREIKAGRPIVITDLNTDPRTTAHAAASIPFRIGAQILIPHLSDGRLDFVIAMQHTTPYAWRADDIALVQDAATRLFNRLERARAEAALRESEERFRTLFNSIDQGFCVVEMLFDGNETAVDYRFLHVNRAFAQQTGVSNATGRTAREIVPHEAYWFALFGAVALTGEPTRFEQRAESLARWFDVHAFRFGRPADRHVAILFSDITERKRAEDALRASEARFRAVADLVPDMLWRNDPRGWTEWYNHRWLEYTGQTLEEAQAYGWLKAIHPDDRDTSLRSFQTAITTGEPLRQEHRVRGVDGAYRWFLLQARPVRDDVGQIVCWYGAGTDVHDERMARQEAEAALDVRDQFLSIASHELRTPLTPLLGYVGMLRASLAQAADGPQRRLVDTIERQTNRLNTLIGSLLDVARLQRGQFDLELQPLDLAGLAAHVVDDFRLTLPRDGARHLITLLKADAAVAVLGDASRLEEVLHNLLSNAVKYSPQGGAIRVRIARQDGEAVLEVADNGIGIPAEAQARLFEPFYRAANIGTLISGFGLGLYIVQEIVQRHGGRIAVDSAEGQGTMVRVVLPLAPDERAVETAP